MYPYMTPRCAMGARVAARVLTATRRLSPWTRRANSLRPWPVVPGNARDAQGALQLVAQSEQHTGLPVTSAMANAAYGDGHTRPQFADAGRTLIAKVPKRPARTHFPKEDFQIDLAAGTCTCPAGQVTSTVRRRGFYATATAVRAPRRYFHFDAALCTACPLRPRGVAAAPGRGRQVSLHPQEAWLQAARTFPHSKACAPYRHLRPAVEHRRAPAGATGSAPGPGTWGVTRPPPSSISPPPSPT